MDSSQTLYEFRAANPRALNIMESSHVFTPYKLETNYRSNPEILDFANMSLAQIEANQIARLRLHANDLTPVTAQSFTDRVHVHSLRVLAYREFETNALGFARDEMLPYVQSCIAKGEQVCLLAPLRREVEAYKTAFELLLPNAKVASLVPKKGYSMTALSNFIERDWNVVYQLNRGNIVTEVTQYILSHIADFSGKNKYAQQTAKDAVTEWGHKAYRPMKAAYQGLVQGAMSTDEYYAKLQESMMDYEVGTNAIRQSLVSQKNREMKESNEVEEADILVSTVHSAKGLEFPHVIVCYRAKEPMGEADKRMYYVALTRARKSELVVAYSTQQTTTIVEQYRTLVHGLQTGDIVSDVDD